MKRHLTTAAAVLVAALGVAACGDDDSGDAGTAAGGSTTTSVAAEQSTASFPVTVEHKFGETVVEQEPERVVVVGYTEQDAVLALGVRPVGVREFLGGYDDEARPWAQEVLGGEDIETVGGEQINFEAVAAQRPDLIVALNTGMKEGDYRRLTRIAPTIAQSGDVVDFGMAWDDQTRLIAKALGREDRAEKVIADVEAKFAEAREKNPGFADATAILAYGGPDGYGAYTSQDTRSRFFADLGFRTPPEVDEIAGESFFAEFSQEQFRLIDQDVVVMFGSEDDVKDNPVFGRLDAVEEDRVIYLDLADQFAGALGFASPLSLPYLLEEAVPKLAAALDGDPATKVEQPE